ncbi:MAG TPA: hypothetical protein V6D48_23970, partial [Oculatellaceae cyanobacterium]
MRDTNQWWRPLYNDIQNHLNKENLPQNLPSLFKAEFGIWLAVMLRLHPKDIWAVLAMSDFVGSNWTQDEKSMIAISSFYISDDRRSWNEGIQRYRAFDSNIRLFDVDQDGSITGHIPLNVLTKKRDGFYRKLSTTPPIYTKSRKEYAQPNKKYFYKVRTTDNRRIVREVTLPAEWAKYVPRTDHFINISLPDPRPIKICLDELMEVARFLDTLEYESNLYPPLLVSGKWVERLDNILFKEFQKNDLLEESREMLLENTVHLPGTLSVGKSTLAFLIAVWSALKGYRITLVLNDVSSILRFINEINQRLLHPLLIEKPSLLPQVKKVKNSRLRNTGRGSSPVA